MSKLIFDPEDFVIKDGDEYVRTAAIRMQGIDIEVEQ